MGSHYAALEDRFRRLGDVEGALAILDWDTAVVMPKAATATRGNQIATLRRLAHDMLTSDETDDLIEGATEERGLDAWQAANLREMQRRFRMARALDPALVEALARATTSCEMVWREARAKADFAMLRGELEEVIRLVRESAVMIGTALGLEPYDALLEAHQPDLRDATVEPVFAALVEALPPIVDSALAQTDSAVRPTGPFAVERQRTLARKLMVRLGFDFDAGRLDESTHPFCGGVPSDVRVTTRYREDEVASALMGVLHETGHALYEAGLPRRWAGQPVGEARGMAVHESQSLLMEMQACRSDAFIGYLSAQLVDAFGHDPAFAAANLVRLYRRVERGLIRVDADEVTYPMHIVLRHRLERAIIRGDLQVAELPAAWNEGMTGLLGIAPPDDRLGCLQDIHWPVGAFGYFPCYTMGALLAAQLFGAARIDLSSLDEDLEAGDFQPLRGWLREKIHGMGSLLAFDQLVERASGGPLRAEAFLDHLRSRYLH
jgi:carboxypeptidase Taq